jgi:hypothetical protein
VSQGLLYIGSSGTGSLVSYDPSTGALATVVSGVDSISGVGGDGCFYLASRKGKSILKYDRTAKQLTTFIKKLPDEPEFLLYLAD